MLLKLEKLDMGTWGIGYSDSLDPLTRMVLDVENHAFVFDVIPCSRNIMIRNISYQEGVNQLDADLLDQSATWLYEAP